MRGNFSGLLAQAQKMQKNVERAQAELANIEVTGEAGAGMVKITVTCKHEAKRVEIDPSLLSGSEDDKEMLEDLIAAAINDAAHKAEAAAQQKMREATAGMPWHEAAVLRLDASSLNAKSLPGLQPVGTFSHFCRAFDAAATLRNTCAFVS